MDSSGMITIEYLTNRDGGANNTEVLSLVIMVMVMERRVSGAKRLIQFRTTLTSKMA